MRVAVFVKGTEEYEAGAMPETDLLVEMGKFNEELIKAGVMLAGDGLQPSSKGKRMRFDGKGDATVIDGPFAEAKELVAGYWIWQVRSVDEAVEWLGRSPFKGGEVEIRPVFEAADFGDNLTEAERRRDEERRQELASS